MYRGLALVVRAVSVMFSIMCLGDVGRSFFGSLICPFVSIGSGRVYPFPRSSVSFKTPPKRKAVPPLSAVLESDWSGVDDWSAGVVEKETFSPRLVDAISRRIVEEVENRTVPTIQTGWFCFLDFVYSLFVRLPCMLWMLSCVIVADLVIGAFLLFRIYGVVRAC